MDELKAPPRVDWLYDLAQKLRKAPEELRRASPVLGALATSGRELLTEPIARGLEHWAYGDRAFGPPANAPLVTERTMDMASALPLGALSKGGVATAQLVPALAIRNADKLAAARLADRVRKADDAVRQGATPDEIWKSFGLTEAPGSTFPGKSGKLSNAHSGAESSAYHTRWLEEINAENKLKPLGSVAKAQYADQVFDSPELFRQYPFLKDIEFQLRPPQKGLGGLYEPGMGERGRITVNKDLNDPGLQHVAAHELSHGVMQNFGQVNSLGHGVDEALSPEELKRLVNMAGFMQVDPFVAEKYGNVPEQIMEFAKTPYGRQTNRKGSWDKSAGEALAEAVSTRLRMPNEMRQAVNPSYAYPKDLLSDVVMDRSAQMARHDLTTPEAGSALAGMLRYIGVIPK